MLKNEIKKLKSGYGLEKSDNTGGNEEIDKLQKELEELKEDSIMKNIENKSLKEQMTKFNKDSNEVKSYTNYSDRFFLSKKSQIV